MKCAAQQNFSFKQNYTFNNASGSNVDKWNSIVIIITVIVSRYILGIFLELQFLDMSFMIGNIRFGSYLWKNPSESLKIENVSAVQKVGEHFDYCYTLRHILIGITRYLFGFLRTLDHYRCSLRIDDILVIYSRSSKLNTILKKTTISS